MVLFREMVSAMSMFVKYLVPLLELFSLQKDSVILWSWQTCLPIPFCMTFLIYLEGLTLFDMFNFSSPSILRRT